VVRAGGWKSEVVVTSDRTDGRETGVIVSYWLMATVISFSTHFITSREVK
jgi:hypothetical protein